ncbi:hypothetical protein AK812_SmicGene20922 [Symbiodinium microadriaticum]|uniref:Uncharacterized protein n=1 Tax=Symbiodinium microadriaticum TaxID=2951 RepID=A0A1Q9DNQ9_SYMMI|nr:hypothetical protein AK812_SmicGene20922 [Symbiodinium microadriaticum]
MTLIMFMFMITFIISSISTTTIIITIVLLILTFIVIIIIVITIGIVIVFIITTITITNTILTIIIVIITTTPPSPLPSPSPSGSVANDGPKRMPDTGRSPPSLLHASGLVARAADCCPVRPVQSAPFRVGHGYSSCEMWQDFRSMISFFLGALLCCLLTRHDKEKAWKTMVEDPSNKAQ